VNAEQIADETRGDVPWRSGLLAIDKPVGVTSHDVVDAVRRRFRTRAVGHLGTLDPGASGLLLAALGPATRFVPLWQGGEKTYAGTVRFGLVTSTQDLQGEVLERRDLVPSEAEIRAASRAFVGDLSQVPPMASAVKIGGERLYRLHRRGEIVERAPRTVSVLAWDWLEFAPPDATFRVRCSGGTYVRTLAHDLGQALGCGATLAALRRERSEPFDLERAVSLRQLATETSEQVWAAAGLSLEQAVAHLPLVRLTAEEAIAVGFGRRPSLARERVAGAAIGAGPRSTVIADAEGHVLGLGELVAEGEHAVQVCPRVLLPWAVQDGRRDAGVRSL
jgi:tRNA pseudouridine55 synthase